MNPAPDANETEALLAEAVHVARANYEHGQELTGLMVEKLCAKVRELQHWETHAATAMRRARLAEDRVRDLDHVNTLAKERADKAEAQVAVLFNAMSLANIRIARGHNAEARDIIVRTLAAHQPAKGEVP